MLRSIHPAYLGSGLSNAENYIYKYASSVKVDAIFESAIKVTVLSVEHSLGIKFCKGFSNR